MCVCLCDCMCMSDVCLHVVVKVLLWFPTFPYDMFRVFNNGWLCHRNAHTESLLMFGCLLVLGSWMMCGRSGVVVVCCGWVGWAG